MHRRLQFGTRENPASDRRHGSRLAVRNPVNEALVKEIGPRQSDSMESQTRTQSGMPGIPDAASPHAATGGEKATQAFEPLIGSCEAARLLGNIHVKTLQRYARRGCLPGYQIGGHWYFRASELDSWLRSQLHSSCHPCRLQEESDGA